MPVDKFQKICFESSHYVSLNGKMAVNDEFGRKRSWPVLSMITQFAWKE
jgi:hypothetical protein